MLCWKSEKNNRGMASLKKEGACPFRCLGAGDSLAPSDCQIMLCDMQEISDRRLWIITFRFVKNSGNGWKGRIRSAGLQKEHLIFSIWPKRKTRHPRNSREASHELLHQS